MTEQAAKGVIRRLTVSIVAIVLLTAALTDLAAAGALSFALAKMFDSEKIISGS